MLTIGQQLYGLTERDLQTLLLAPFTRGLPSAFGIGVGLQSWDVEIPPDRSLFLASCSLYFAPDGSNNSDVDLVDLAWVKFPQSGGNPVESVLIHRRRPGDSVGLGPVFFDNQVTVGRVSGLNGVINLKPELLLPPGGVLRVTGERFGPNLATSASPVDLWFYGWLVPAGQLGRL